jgi:hypothetical protein
MIQLDTTWVDRWVVQGQLARESRLNLTWTGGCVVGWLHRTICCCANKLQQWLGTACGLVGVFTLPQDWAVARTARQGQPLK